MTISQERYSFNRSFQERVILLLLRDPSFLREYYDVISPSYFEYEYLSIVARTATKLFLDHNEIPIKDSLDQALGEYCESYNVSPALFREIHELLDKVYRAETLNLAAIRDRVIQFGKRQALKQALLELGGLVKKDEDYDKARGILDKALQVGSGTRELGSHLGQDLLRLPDLAKLSSYTKERKIPTLFPTIDRYTHGGPARKEVWIVGARSGVGKSTCLVQLGVSALLSPPHHRVVHYTVGDLDEVDVLMRYGSRLTGCPIRDIVTSSKTYLERAAKRGKYCNDLWVKHFSSGQASMSHIRSHLSQLKYHAGFSPDLIIVDYPDELKLEENVYRDIGNIYADIQAVAHDYDSLALVASQLKTEIQEQKYSKEGNNPRVVARMADLDHSKLKWAKADGVITLNQTRAERAAGKMRLWVDKTRRYGSNYLLDVAVDYSIYSLKELGEVDTTG